MYKRIVLDKNLSTKEKLKRVTQYFLRVRGARILWNKQFKLKSRQVPGFKKSAGQELEREHIAYWKPIRKYVNPATLRICQSISGHAHPKCIPEEVYMADIEPTLNGIPSSGFLSLKSVYNRWYRGHVFPEDYFHKIEGNWMDPDLNTISFDDVIYIINDLEYPVVLKLNRNSYGGRGVFFPRNSKELKDLIRGKTDFLVQEKIVQHPFFDQFNPHGFHSVRVNLYRSVVDDQVHILHHALRMGVGDSLDNLTSGGISTMIRKDGVLDGFAEDIIGRKYYTHPDSGIAFDMAIPDFEELIKLSLLVAEKVLYRRIICLDLCYDYERRWRIFEVNFNSNTIKFSQHHGVPFFDEYTDEVRQYCVEHHWALSPRSEI